jgi:phosphoglycolate phosphatase
MVPTELAVFDLDGTLIDSIGDLADAMNAVLQDLGHPAHPRDDYRFLVGDGIEILVRRALPPEVIEATNIASVVQQMRREYSTRWTATTRPFPEIPELLVELHARKIRTTVLSNKPDSPTREIVGELFPNNPFAIVRGALDGIPLKPDPTAALEITTSLGVSPQQSVFVGDTAVDMATGVNAGMRSVGVSWGFRDADELVDAGADHIIRRPLELLEFIEGTARRGVKS